MTKKKRERTDFLVHRYTLRLDKATHEWIEAQTKSSGFRNGHEFLRELVKREKAGNTDAFNGLESRIAATLMAQSTEIDRLQRTGFANFAAVMNLANLFLQTFLPPTREARQVLDANYKKRFDTFLQELGQEMKGRWANALQDFEAEFEDQADEN